MQWNTDLIWPLVIGGIVLILSAAFTLADDVWHISDAVLYQLSWIAAFSVIGFLISFLIVVYRKFQNEVDNRVQKIIEFSALHTDNRTFENALTLLKTEGGAGVRWLLAKFISHKLANDFAAEEGGGIRIYWIKPPEYSELLGQLIRECRDEVLMTFPYLPKEWLQDLSYSSCGSCDGTECITARSFSDVKPSGHLEALQHTRDNVRKLRLITKAWQTSDPGDEKCGKVVCEMAKNQLKLEMKEFALNENDDASMKQKIETDYNILDGIVVTYHKPEVKKSTNSDPWSKENAPYVELIFGPVQTAPYRTLFSLTERHNPINIC